jgi:negative regulator of sigma E activity
MNDEIYRRWLRRADAEAPADFGDRVMAAVRREPPPAKGVLVLPLSSPTVRVAACVLASLACLYRMAAVVAVFFAQ